MNFTPGQLLEEWLARRLAPEAAAWLSATCRDLAIGGDTGLLRRGFGLVPRRVGKADLSLDQTERDRADAARKDWRPGTWSCDQAARVLLLLSFPAVGPEALRASVGPLFACAELGELVALLRGLPLYPWGETFLDAARGAARSSIVTAFAALAQDNPYPAEFFPPDAWNQLILKAFFVGVAVDPIIGLDHRANPDLATMLLDYAYERWAAGRPVSPELWRLVGPFAGDGRAAAALARVVRSDDALERRAGSLASGCPLPARSGAASPQTDSWSMIALAWQTRRP